VQGPKRKLVYVTLYELIAVVCSTGALAALSGRNVGASGLLSVAASCIAVVWNLIFNTLFEAWEARQRVRGRSVARRVAHAIGFEGGLVAALVPLIAWWYDISLLDALGLDLALVVFFLVYTFVFNWLFDRLFGLPASAQGDPVRGV
jgi:uncharacterized membrane protein